MNNLAVNKRLQGTRRDSSRRLRKRRSAAQEPTRQAKAFATIPAILSYFVELLGGRTSCSNTGQEREQLKLMNNMAPTANR